MTCVLALIIAGCTSKDNTVGIDGKDEIPTTFEIQSDSLFAYYYSYSDTVGPSFPNNKLISGKFTDNTSITLLRFSNLPAEGFNITADAELKVNISGNYEAAGMPLKLALIEQNWSPREATWAKADDVTSWRVDWLNAADLEVISTTEVTDSDSLTFLITGDELQPIIEDWISSEPSTFGLAILTESNYQNGYVEFFNKDNRDFRPELIFEFTHEDDQDEDEPRLYQRPPIYNTFINSIALIDDLSYRENELLISNLPAHSMVVKLDLDHIKAKISSREEDLTAEELKRITINKADLILHIDEEKSHYSPTVLQASVRPFNLMEEFADRSELPIAQELTELLLDNYGSTIHFGEEKLSINITSTLQAHISGLRENKGVVLRSTVERPDNTFLTAENRDNTFIMFFNHQMTDETLRPYLKMTYTVSPF